ncbi:MAG: hypothetical protein CMM46_08340 [Rhodospirillaceae bacterium]|nr:hypothetical protein [Rhodospirillaceae bacterium]
MRGVFTVPAGTSFVDAIAATVIDQFGGPPERLADVLILVPTRRAIRSLSEAFLRQSGGRSLIQPDVRALGDVDEDELTVAVTGNHLADTAVPPAITPLRRQLILANRIRSNTQFGVANDEQATQLAAALASFIDEVETAEADFTKLSTLVSEERLSEHWQITLRFLTTLTEGWKQQLGNEGRVDPAVRRRLLLDRLGAIWADTPPQGPVIAAGSTGTIPATARLLARVAKLPQGMVVLPGLDQVMDSDAWERIDDSHPQHALRALLETLETSRDQVELWPIGDDKDFSCGNPSRHSLMSQALLPADAEVRLTDLTVDPRALDGLHIAPCGNPREEAQVASLRMRLELEEPGRTVALVTRDRDLARRVAADLKRWSIDVDDSAGEPLGTTPAGTFLRLVAQAAHHRWAPIPLLALLKHPFLRLRREAAEVRSLARRLEISALRGPRPATGLRGLRSTLSENSGCEDLLCLINDLEVAVVPFDELLQSGRIPLSKIVTAHVAALEALAEPPDVTEGSIWQHDDGEALQSFVAELLADAEAMGVVDPGSYPALLETLLASRAVRPKFGQHPRAFIWGPLEARMQHADCLILAGLVEGNWPPEPPGDPWMSRPMRAQFGLATPEQRIGLAAHDFVQAACGASVMILHAERADGAPTVPARWLVRLQTLLDVHGLGQGPLTDATVWRRWQATLDRPPAVEPVLAPTPRPPLEARPGRLSVTQIETWQRDPYATYAEHILRLKPLDDLDEDADAATRGSFIHAALEAFVKRHPVDLPEKAEDELLEIGRSILGPMLERPSVTTFWWRRFERVAAWFVAEEKRRRRDLESVVAEARGNLIIPLDGTNTFTVSAKADRLEQRQDGSVSLIDYKTGRVPPKKAVTSGKAPQLPLEAAMVERGGFNDVGERSVSGLEFWSLSGGDPPAAILPINDDASSIGQEAVDGLKRLASAFADPDTAYLDHPSGEEIGRFDRYTDVARTNEWRLGWRTLLDDVLYGTAPPRRTPRPRSANDLQQAMSDPRRTVWVAASAGTGKTKVLTDRVLRLLLGGTPASRILCLTFTRAAAAEMANRIRGELAGWVALSETDLEADLLALTGEKPTEEQSRQARRLFATVLDAPGGLQITTIHSFCQSLLGRFPLEAGVAPHFGLIEDRDRSELLREARDSVIGRIARSEATDLHDALHHLILKAGEARAGELIDEVCANADHLDRILAKAGSMDRLLNALALALDADPASTDIDLLSRASRDGAFDHTGLSRAAEALLDGAATDVTRSRKITIFLEATPEQRADVYETYRSAFLTGKNKPRKKLATKGVSDAQPWILDVLSREQERLLAIQETRHALAAYRRTWAVVVLGHTILADFRRRKQDKAVLDYGDLIDRTRALLTESSMAPWVLFKLDGGIDHVLVDEAQDTNPGQWEVVLTLINEFFAGEGVREEQRTLFVVGDEKQSIFSFQGADLEALQQVRSHLRQTVPEPEWFSANLDLSYRSVSAVLDAVDAVFADPTAAQGVTFADEPIRHSAFREYDGGLVEVWPLLREAATTPGDPWTACLQETPRTNRFATLAGTIAERIAAMTGDDDGPGDILSSRGDTIRAGDVLILVRRRSEIVASLVRELRRAGVAVAGVDRMDLTGEIVVRDLLVLGRTCLLPEDDMALAAVLKGPLIGLDDTQLFNLAWERPDRGHRPTPLWHSLRDQRHTNEAFDRAASWLEGLMAQVDYLAPFEFFDTVLTSKAATSAGYNGRKALIGRLGLEAQDPLDEFLSLALSFERDHPPSLQGFIWWLGSGTSEVKREAEGVGDAVRIMTVHGAKGLQAPVVFLIDELTKPGRRPAILWDDQTDLPLWAGSDGERDRWSQRLIDQRSERSAEEERRLLYVAMTRASDRLYVCGCASSSAKTEGTWFGMIHNALAPLVDIEHPEDGVPSGEAWDGQTLRLSCEQSREVLPPDHDDDASLAVVSINNAVHVPMAPERSIDRPISPSKLGGKEPKPRSPLQGDAAEAAMRRGRLVHRLLELLPGCPSKDRADAAAGLIALHTRDWPPGERDELVHSVLDILDDPQFNVLFAPGSRAEVSVSGAVGDTVVAGQIDRLVITDDAVTIVDYKTGRIMPESVEQTPIAYLRQLAAYREVLQAIYPERAVTCALLWTDIPYLVAIPNVLLDTHRPDMHGGNAS